MLVTKRGTTIYHTPKTGGTWLRLLLRRLGLLDREVDRHLAPADKRPEGRSIAFVRHPVRWYKALWAYMHGRPEDQVRHSRSYRLPQGKHHWWAAHGGLYVWTFADRPLVDWCERIVLEMPGWCGRVFDAFTDGVDFIGRQESLVEDTLRILGQCGEDIDEDFLRRFPPQNVTGSERRALPPEIERRIVDAEAHAIEKYGYG